MRKVLSIHANAVALVIGSVEQILQRVAIARALAPEPDLVLADEPTASLDSKSGQDVVELLGDLCRRRSSAVLLVTHDLRLLKDADRIWGVEDGRIHPWEEEEAKHNLSH